MAIQYVFNPFTGNLDAIDISSGSSGVFGPASSTDNAITRWDGTSGSLVQNSNALVQDGGGIQAQGYVGKKEIDDAIVLPAKHYMIATGITIMATGSITIGSDSELVLI